MCWCMVMSDMSFVVFETLTDTVKLGTRLAATRLLVFAPSSAAAFKAAVSAVCALVQQLLSGAHIGVCQALGH